PEQYNINRNYRKRGTKTRAESSTRRHKSAEEGTEPQTEERKRDVEKCYMQKGKWHKPWWNTWMMAVTTRVVN
ncbi:MAG: hypothetical protein GY820_46600, partial [Gammaproteobacteria bacterium]|nr:hypothetical protein [Gammaproteobacteria bacterium]